MTLSIMFLACHRPAYCEKALSTLVTNTDWAKVESFYIMQDYGTESGGGQIEALFHNFLSLWRPHKPCAFLKKHSACYGGPIPAMLEFLRVCRSDILVKIDEDTLMPPGWLDHILRLITPLHRARVAIGLEPFKGYSLDCSEPRTLIPANRPVGGLFAIPRRLFLDHPLKVSGRIYDGWYEWQLENHANFIPLWLSPGLPVCLLDRIPSGPWRDLGAQYEQAGLQRPWKRYNPDADLWRMYGLEP